MLRIIQILILCGFCFNLSAQWGIRTTYNLNSASKWDAFFSEIEGQNQKVFSTSIGLTADYWMRLPNQRIEFYPNISFHQAKTRLIGNFAPGQLGTFTDIRLRQVGIGVITHFYLLDLLGDCECPTFSKQGSLIKKGFFLMAGLGGDYSQKSIGEAGFRDGNIDLKFSGGIGLDIGLSDLITISPFLQYQYYPHVSWHELGIPFNKGNVNVESSLGQFQMGIRIGLRPDYK